MQFRIIDFDSAAYRQSLRLREQVLRQPLGLMLSRSDLDGEQAQWHFGLFDGHGRLAACLVATPTGERSVRLRQMAVAPQHHSRGLGRQLVRDVEEELGRRGVTSIRLHARTSASGFYQKLGYRATGRPFMEVGVEHRAMQKTLTRDPPP